MKIAIQIYNKLKVPENIYVGAYCNGREQGIALKFINNTLCFSEYRNSDDIVVYTGTSEDFTANVSIPNTKTWENREFFSRTEIKKATQYIQKWIDIF